LTKCLLDENYLRGILRGNEALPDGAKFFVPNLLAHQGTPLATESWLRWHVPADDNSHEQFTVGFFGDVPLTGEPHFAVRRILAKATDEIRMQLGVSADAAMKKLYA
jgi:hypothetical protein